MDPNHEFFDLICGLCIILLMVSGIIWIVTIIAKYPGPSICIIVLVYLLSTLGYYMTGGS